METLKFCFVFQSEPETITLKKVMQKNSCEGWGGNQAANCVWQGVFVIPDLPGLNVPGTHGKLKANKWEHVSFLRFLRFVYQTVMIKV